MNKTEDLIIVKQLPIIEEQLKSISEEVKSKVNDALALVCNKEALPKVKEARAELNKMFKDIDERRKAVKQKIAEPYVQFEEKYKEYIADVFKGADHVLKTRITEVEEARRQEKRDVVKLFFDEQCKKKNIEFLTFDDLGIDITLSASEQSLKEKVMEYIDKVINDVVVINSQPFRYEIMYEYQKTKNLAYSIKTVTERKNALAQADEPKAEPKMEAPKVETTTGAKPLDEKIYTVCLAISGSRRQMNSLKEFFEISGMKWEAIKK